MSDAIEKARVDLRIAMHNGNIVEEVECIDALILAHLAAHQPAPAQPAATGDEFFEAVRRLNTRWCREDEYGDDEYRRDVQTAWDDENERRARG